LTIIGIMAQVLHIRIPSKKPSKQDLVGNIDSTGRFPAVVQTRGKPPGLPHITATHEAMQHQGKPSYYR